MKYVMAWTSRLDAENGSSSADVYTRSVPSVRFELTLSGF